MAKRTQHKSISTPVRASATAKVEAVAKAIYQHKKTTTEIIPPDVTRAKAGRWLDFISPITEWAGLRGDALRFQREQLRIGQETALEVLAESVRTNMAGRAVIHPLPPKILIPALEGASLESPDSPLLQWWARLLVSGATRRAVRPYLVELMKTLGNEEALFLETLWRQFCSDKQNAEILHLHFDAAAAMLPQLNLLRARRKLADVMKDAYKQISFQDKHNSENIKASVDAGLQISAIAAELGIGISGTFPFVDGSTWLHASTGFSWLSASFDVSRALNLIGTHVEEMSISDKEGDKRSAFIDFFHFTSLGIELMTSTHS